MATSTASTEAATARVTIEGTMTIYEALDHKRELLEALAAGDRLEIDLAGVDEIDTAGVQLLVLLQREADAAGKPVAVVTPSAAVLEVLERYGLCGRFGIAASMPAPDTTQGERR